MWSFKPKNKVEDVAEKLIARFEELKKERVMPSIAFNNDRTSFVVESGQNSVEVDEDYNFELDELVNLFIFLKRARTSSSGYSQKVNDLLNLIPDEWEFQ